MSKKKQTQLIQMLLGLLVVVVLLVVGILANKSAEAHRQAEAEASTPRLVQVDNVTQMTLTNTKGVTSFEKSEDGSWHWVTDEDFPLDESTCTALAELVQDFTAEQGFDAEDTLSAYGLEDSTKTLTVSNDTGESQTILLGTTTGDLYYAMVQDNSGVIYTIDSTLNDALENSIYDMAKSADYPALSADIIQDVTIQGQKHKETFTVQPVEVEVTDEDSDSEDASTSAEPELTTEYHFFHNGQDINGDSLATAFRTELDTISTEALTEFKPSDTLRQQCGLTKPTMTVTVHYTLDNTTQTLVLTVGNQTEDESYYCELSTAPNCIYTIAGNDLEDLLSVATKGYDSAKKAVDAQS